jgi:Transmembrane Fragile-X-F protein
MYFVFLTFQQVYRTRLFIGIFGILLSASRHYNYLELLDSVQSDMVLEIYGYQWRTRGKLRVVEASSLQVCDITKRLIKWVFKDCLFDRLEGEAYVHYKAMLISLAMHLILLMFELLACDKLESGRHLWILVFIPLLFISIASIAVCVWAVKHDRAFEVIAC